MVEVEVELVDMVVARMVGREKLRRRRRRRGSMCFETIGEIGAIKWRRREGDRKLGGGIGGKSTIHDVDIVNGRRASNSRRVSGLRRAFCDEGSHSRSRPVQASIESTKYSMLQKGKSPKIFG